MHDAVTFCTNGARTQLWLLDANEHTPCLGGTCKAITQFPEAAFRIVRRDANHT